MSIQANQLPTTITGVVKMPVEDLEGLGLSLLAVLHQVVSAGATKQARLRADLIAGIIKAKKEAKKAEPVVAENSAKPATKKPAKKGKKDADKVAEPAVAVPKKPVKSAKKAEEAAPDLTTMSPEQLMAYAQKLKGEKKATPAKKQDKPVEKFPATIDGQKVRYTRVNFGKLEELQQALVNNPFRVYLMLDEKLDDGKLTQCLVTYASKNLILLVDKSRKVDTIIEALPNAIDGELVTVLDKKSKFPCAIYVVHPKE